MRKLLIIGFIIISSLIIKIPEYRELNNLKIIESVGLDCVNNKIYLKEIIPIKEDNGIKYEYIIYTSSNSINNKFYLNNTKYIITNCDNTSNFVLKNKIKFNYIYHTQADIKKELSKS